MVWNWMEAYPAIYTWFTRGPIDLVVCQGDNLSCWGWSLQWWGLTCSGFGGSPFFKSLHFPHCLLGENHPTHWVDIWFFFSDELGQPPTTCSFLHHYISWRILWIIFGGKSINGRSLKLEIWTIKTYPTQSKTPVVPWFASDWLAKLPRRHSRSWRFWKWKKTSCYCLDMQSPWEFALFSVI